MAEVYRMWIIAQKRCENKINKGLIWLFRVTRMAKSWLLEKRQALSIVVGCVLRRQSAPGIYTVDGFSFKGHSNGNITGETF